MNFIKIQKIVMILNSKKDLWEENIKMKVILGQAQNKQWIKINIKK